MTTHTVIESLAAYETVRTTDPEGKRAWWTTSPFLLIRLPELGETVRSPEEGITNEEFDALARAGRDLVPPLCLSLRAISSWDKNAGADLEHVFGSQIQRCFFVTFYKGLLLDRVLAEAAGEPVACVGDPDDPGLSGLSLTYSRFETLFARLAALWQGSGITVVKHTDSQLAGAKIEDGITNRKFGADEKILSLLNNTASSILYKLWRNLKRRHLWPWCGVSLWPKPRRTIHVLKDCELIEEAFLGVLLRGGRVTVLPSQSRPDLSIINSARPFDVETAMAIFRRLCRKALEQEGVPWRNSFAPCVELAGARILTCFEGVLRYLPQFEKEFAKRFAGIRLGDEIIGSSINPLPERLFAAYSQKRGVRVNTVDHGVTFGLSEWSMFHAAFSGMGVGERGFYHCSRAAAAIGRHVRAQQAHVVGLPKITQRPPLQALQRYLARRLLRLAKDEGVVMIVCDADRNNFVYGPHQDNDLRFLNKTRQLAKVICEAFPASTVILKLYPTQRYLDEYDFSDLRPSLTNLRIVKNVELRFIRMAADLLLTSSTQSTLGWVSGANRPYLYLDFSWSPGKIAGLRLSLDGVDGLSSVIRPDAWQVCSRAETSLAQILMGNSQSQSVASATRSE